MIGDLVEFLGRPLFWLLAVVAAIVVAAGAYFGTGALADNQRRQEEARTITLAQVLAEGCCILRIKIDISSSVNYGSYAVETQIGRAPSSSRGTFTRDNNLEIFVGHDWVGRVVVTFNGCRPLSTNLLGGQFGLAPSSFSVRWTECSK